ncbi:zinc-ribbon domain-containing protein [Nocardioides exalbidus]|nr:zinc-ribbon domain-containing protein [Nocardioides exalbidus]
MQTSRPEIALWAEIATVLGEFLGEGPAPDVAVRRSVRLPRQARSTSVVDMAVMWQSFEGTQDSAERWVGIEYDGAYHHAGREVQDAEKHLMLEAEGHVLIRARERPLDPLASSDVSIPPGVFIDPQATHKAAAAVLAAVAAVPGCPQSARSAIEDYLARGVCVGTDAFNRRYSNRVLPDLGAESIAATHPELVPRLWAYDKNEACVPFHQRHLRAPGRTVDGRTWPWAASISPRQVRADSSRKVWWRCEEYGDYFVMAPRDVVCGRGCQFCGHKQINDRTCLLSTDPALAAQIDSADPTVARSMSAGENKLIKWLCSVCGHSWSRTLKVRKKFPKCPTCRHDPTAPEPKGPRGRPS